MIPSVARRVISEHIVGRDAEIGLATQAITATLEGSDDRVELVLIGGEAGVGKTRLLNELVERACAGGALVIGGRCLEHGGEIRPLSAIVELLSELAPLAEDHGVAIPAELAPLLGGGAGGSATALSETPAKLDDQIRWLLGRITHRRPVVVTVEDLHWADQTTRRLLSTLLRARDLGRFLVLASYRSDELHRRHPLLPFLAEIQRTVRCEHIELPVMELSEITDLAAAILGESVDAATAASLWQRCGGNPFYAEELLAAGLDRPQPPPGVRHVILARMQSLTPHAIRCLDAAATMAAPIDSMALRAACALETDAQCRAAADELCNERFLVESAHGLTFRHELVREVVLDDLLPGERTELMAAAAQALERHRPDRLGEIARLHLLAEQLPEALRASIAAAEAAESIGAMAEASEHYGRGLDIWSRVGDTSRITPLSHVQLLRRTARAANLARSFDRAVELARMAVDEAGAVGSDEEGSILVELTQYLWYAGSPGLDDVIARGLAVIPAEPPSIERVRMEIRHAGRLRMRGEVEVSDALLRSAAESAAALGDLGAVADARAGLEYERAMLGDEHVVARMREAFALAASIDDGPIAAKIAINLCNALLFLGRYQEAAAIHAIGLPIIQRHGLMPTHGILLEGNVVQALEPIGRWDEAAAIVADIHRSHSAESVHRWASALVGWSQILINRGRFADAAPTYQRGFELQSSGYYEGDLGPLGNGAVELARAGAAAPITAETVTSWIELIPVQESVWAARLAANSIRYLVPPTSAREHRYASETAAGWIDRIRQAVDDHYIEPPVALEIWLEQASAELRAARHDQDPEPWARIVVRWDEFGCPYFAAAARFRCAETLLLAGGARSSSDRARARELLIDAARTAMLLEAEPLARDTEDLARRARLTLDGAADAPERTRATRGAFDLTRQELEVLRLVSEGRSNGEIGDRLFISRKTASVHVSNILRKLGAANRIEAAAIARRHGL
jgi:DNA-binding CsgD family transcriptional regulator